MKKIFIAIVFFPLMAAAQKPLPRFENDTLYTSSGYPIYKGQVLHLAMGTSSGGYFKYIKFHTSQFKTNTYSLANSTIIVNKLKAYKNPDADNGSIRIIGTVSYKDSIKEETDIIMNFDKVTESYNDLPPEIIVPAEFKSKQTVTVKTEVKKPVITEDTKKPVTTPELKKSVADEIRKLFDLYKEGALTKEEYEAAKKKVLEKQ